MLTPIQAITSAILTALIVQLITLKFTEIDNIKVNNEPNNNNELKIVDEIKEMNQVIANFPNISDVPDITGVPRSEEPEDVNKLMDAIFVTHGVEDEQERNEKDDENEVEDFENQIIEPQREPITKKLVPLDEDNFNSLFTDDWLVLAYVPWYSESLDYLGHFKEQYTYAMTEANSTLNLAVLDCHTHPRLAALLNIRSYPSLNLVTTSGRLREWPFQLSKLNHQSLRFLINAEWRNLPVYQLLQHDDKNNPNIFLNELQVKVFNIVTSVIFKYKPILSEFIVNNRRPISMGLLCGLGLSYHLLCKQAITIN